MNKMVSETITIFKLFSIIVITTWKHFTYFDNAFLNIYNYSFIYIILKYCLHFLTAWKHSVVLINK